MARPDPDSSSFVGSPSLAEFDFEPDDPAVMAGGRVCVPAVCEQFDEVEPTSARAGGRRVEHRAGEPCAVVSYLDPDERRPEVDGEADRVRLGVAKAVGDEFGYE